MTWLRIETCPEEPLRKVWIAGGFLDEPTLSQANGNYWRRQIASRQTDFIPTHWAPCEPPPWPPEPLPAPPAAED